MLMITYDQVESESIRECERRLDRRFAGRNKGRLKCATAHVMQSIRRHGTDNPGFLKREAYKSALAALGIWEILAPIVVPFLKQAIGVLVEYLLQLIDGLAPDDPTINKTVYQSNLMTSLADEAQRRWPQRGLA